MPQANYCGAGAEKYWALTLLSVYHILIKTAIKQMAPLIAIVDLSCNPLSFCFQCTLFKNYFSEYK